MGGKAPLTIATSSPPKWAKDIMPGSFVQPDIVVDKPSGFGWGGPAIAVVGGVAVICFAAFAGYSAGQVDGYVTSAKEVRRECVRQEWRDVPYLTFNSMIPFALQTPALLTLAIEPKKTRELICVEWISRR